MEAFTALTFLVALSRERPGAFRAEPERIATIALAAERAQSDAMARWHHHPRMLGGVILETILAESSLSKLVHSGEVRGHEGEICLTQISPINPRWHGIAPTFESLAGVDLVSTTACIRAGVATLLAADRLCTARHPRKDWLPMMWTGYQYSGRCFGGKQARVRSREALRLAWTQWRVQPEHVHALAEVLEDQ